MQIEASRSISARIVTVFILCFFAITLVLFALQCVIEYSSIKKHIRHDFEKLQKEYLHRLTDAYHQGNDVLVHSILRGIYNAYAVGGAILESADGSEAIAIGQIPENAREYTLLEAPLKNSPTMSLPFGDAYEMREFELAFVSDSGQSVRLGRLLVYTNTSLLVDELLNSLFFSGVQALAYFIGVSLVLIYLVRRMVARPLGALAEEMKNVTKEDPENIVLKAPVQNYSELQALFASFNFMLLSFISARKALRTSALAIEVRNRALTASERKYRELFENAIEGMFIVSLGGEVIDANPAFATLLGYASVNEFKSHVRDIRTQCFEHAADFDAISQESKETFTTCYLDTRFVRKQGEVFPGTLAIRPYRDKKANALFFRGSLVDITERLLKQQAEKEKEAAKIASKTKGDFLAQMSHEIRTPMNGVIGLTRLALASENSEDQRDLLQHVLSSSLGMMHLLDEILDFSRIEAGMLKLERIPFDLEEIFNYLTANLGPEVGRKQLELVYDFAADVPLQLVGDPLRLRQVLMNLASNAVKFTEKGEIVIRCDLLVNTEEELKLEFSVFDTGIGMDEEQQSQLFKAFSQADLSICRKYGGSGLGLVICAKLVKNMGGRIDVTSMPEKGSVFSFSAGFERNSDQDVAADTKDCLAMLSGKKALVFDDNNSSGAAIVRLLERAGLQASYHHSETEMLRFLSGEEVRQTDYLIIDGEMCLSKEGDVVQVVEQARTAGTVPVVMRQAFGADCSKELQKAVGHRVLLKPVTPASIISCLCAPEGTDANAATLPVAADLRKDESGLLPLIPLPKGIKVLLVEDNEVNAKVAQRTLNILGCFVTHVSTGPQAVETTRGMDYDIVLMDIQLPGMNGYDAARAIRSEPRLQELPIIALTAHAFANEQEKSLAAGMNEHLCKPLDPVQLQRILKKWCSTCGDVAPQEELEAIPVDQQGMPFALPGIDLQDVKRRMLGDWSLLLDTMQAFRREFAGFSTELAEVLQEKDLKKGAELLHSLKGASANISAASLRDISLELELQIKASGDTAELLHKLNRELTLVLKTLEKLEGLDGVLQ